MRSGTGCNLEVFCFSVQAIGQSTTCVHDFAYPTYAVPVSVSATAPAIRLLPPRMSRPELKPSSSTLYLRTWVGGRSPTGRG